MEIWKLVSLLVLSKWKDGGQFWIEILVWRICFIFYCYFIVVVQLSCGSYIYVFMLYSQTNTTHLSPILHTVEWRIEVSTNIYPVFCEILITFNTQVISALEESTKSGCATIHLQLCELLGLRALRTVACCNL